MSVFSVCKRRSVHLCVPCVGFGRGDGGVSGSDSGSESGSGFAWYEFQGSTSQQGSDSHFCLGREEDCESWKMTMYTNIADEFWITKVLISY